jgi:hypothetical protein
MTLTDIAKLIPAKYRSEIVMTNMIQNAQATPGNPSLAYLFTIWKEYVEPSQELAMECAACVDRVLKNYRSLLPVFIELEKEARLLNNV